MTRAARLSASVSQIIRMDPKPNESAERSRHQSVDRLGGWSFHVEEVSANVYVVEGVDQAGRRVSRKGIDPEALLVQCKQDALTIATRFELPGNRSIT